MKVAVILSGCGFRDGSEIHESVLCLLALAQKGHDVHCFAPDKSQVAVVNHLTGAKEEGGRNVLVESARIARGKISPLAELNPNEFDGILLPGGFGAASNLSSFGADKEQCTVDKDLKKSILQFHSSKKPIGATCISPAPLAKIFQGVAQVTMTLGTNSGANENLEKMDMIAKAASASEMVADEKNKVFTTPCYMEPDDLAGMFEGIKKVVQKMEEACLSRV